MTIHRFLLAGALSLGPFAAQAAERIAVDVAHELDAARPAETIAIPWSDVNRMLPGALMHHIAVRDAAGHVLPCQVISASPDARDAEGKGTAYGDLVFQHDFAAGERKATFTIEKTAAVSPPFAPRVFARYVPERLDDFAWENDRVAHRTYGPALAAPDTAGTGKEVLVTSGLDVWFKRVDYPVIDRWYAKGSAHYHKDEGEGLDMYGVGTSRGAGGTGIWDGKRLYTSRNYAGWKVIANGPIRAIFELTYAPWDAAGVRVAEVKRFTVDAGHEFDSVESTFSFSGPARLQVALGLNRKPAYDERSPAVKTERMPAQHALAQWVTQRSDGDFGVAVILPTAERDAYAQDPANELILTQVQAGKPLRYLVGAAPGWSADVHDARDWQRKIAAEAARLAAPIRITLHPLDVNE
jgi:hypothetical protein